MLAGYWCKVCCIGGGCFMEVAKHLPPVNTDGLLMGKSPANQQVAGDLLEQVRLHKGWNGAGGMQNGGEVGGMGQMKADSRPEKEAGLVHNKS